MLIIVAGGGVVLSSGRKTSEFLKPFIVYKELSHTPSHLVSTTNLLYLFYFQFTVIFPPFYGCDN